MEIKVTSYYCSSPLGHEDGSQSACSDDASACWTWSLGGYYTRRKGLLCSASIMASKMVGESKAAQWNLVWSYQLNSVLPQKFFQGSKFISTWHERAKGQLISKCPFGVFKSPKKRISALVSEKSSNQRSSVRGSK